MFLKSRILIIILFVLFNVFETNDCIIIKLITEKKFKNGNYLLLEQNIPPDLEESSCKWYKLNENREIDDSGNSNESDTYIYMHTPQQ